jgi:3-oxoadipate enol-lactonase
MTESSGQPEDGFIAGPFGRIHYLETGVGAPLVLLHSVGSSAYEFEHIMERLAGHFHVVAWDMPGHGDSDPLPCHLTISDYSAALLSLIQHLELRQPHLVGTSIGAQIAACATKQAAEVASVSLVELPLRSLGEWIKIWPIVETIFSCPTQSFEQVAPRFRDLQQSDLSRWNIDRNKAGAKAMMSAMWALRDHRLDLNAILTPTLLLYGEQGAVADSIPLATAALPKARVVTLPKCGHFPMIDDPTAFGETIRVFISSLIDLQISSHEQRN